MKIRNLSAVFTILAVSLVLLSGCGSKDTQKSSETQMSSSSTTTTTQSSTSAAEQQAAKVIKQLKELLKDPNSLQINNLTVLEYKIEKADKNAIQNQIDDLNKRQGPLRSNFFVDIYSAGVLYNYQFSIDYSSNNSFGGAVRSTYCYGVSWDGKIDRLEDNATPAINEYNSLEYLYGETGANSKNDKAYLKMKELRGVSLYKLNSSKVMEIEKTLN